MIVRLAHAQTSPPPPLSPVTNLVAGQENPYDLQFDLGSKAVKLTWSHGPNPAPAYQIQRISSVDGIQVLANVSPGTTTYLDNTVALEEKYTYRLVEITNTGTYTLGRPSNEAPIRLRAVTFGTYCSEYKLEAGIRNNPLGAVYFANLEVSADPMDYLSYTTVPNGDEFPVGKWHAEAKTVVTQGFTYGVDWNAATTRFEPSGPPYTTDEWAFTNAFGQITQDNNNNGYGFKSGPADNYGYTDANFVMYSFEDFAGTYAIPNVQMEVFTNAGPNSPGVPAIKEFGRTVFPANDDYDADPDEADNADEVLAYEDNDLVKVVIKLTGLSPYYHYPSGGLYIPKHLRVFKANGTLLVADQETTTHSYVHYQPGAASGQPYGKLSELDSGELTLYVESPPTFPVVTDDRLMVYFDYLNIHDEVSLVPVKVTFEAIEDNRLIEDNKASGTLEWMPGKGRRMFPEWKSKDDAVEHNRRQKVWVKVQCPVASFPLTLKTLDVDDPSRAENIFNENDVEQPDPLRKGDDNRDWTINGPNRPTFTANNSETRSVVTNSLGVAVEQLKVPTHAGDNLRVAVGSGDYVGLTLLGSLQTTNTEYDYATYVAGDSNQQPRLSGVAVSPMLTMWRTLHVEVDCMQGWTNYPLPQYKPSMDRTVTWAISMTTTPTGTFTKFDLSEALEGASVNFYQGGYIQNSAGGLFNISLNGEFTIDVRHRPWATGQDSFLNSAFAVYDDDDRDASDEWAHGAGSAPLVQTLPSNPLGNPNSSESLRTPYREAYIEIEPVSESAGYNANRTIPFILNMNSEGYPDLALWSAHDMNGADRPEYWYHHAVIAYQPPADEDGDGDPPTTTNMMRGCTYISPPNFNIFIHDTSILFVETIREVAMNGVQPPQSVFAKFQTELGRTTAHEFGHANGHGNDADHLEGGIMDPQSPTDEFLFNPATLKRLRNNRTFQRTLLFNNPNPNP